MAEIPSHIQTILEYDRLFRSQLIYEAIALEGQLDKIIAWHFCPDEAKHGLLFSLVFREGQIGFSAKIQVIRKLLKHAYPELREGFGHLPKALDRLRALRNKFAHSEVVLPDDPPSADSASGVTLKSWKDGSQVQEFVSRASVDQQLKESMVLLVTAVVLEDLLRKRALGTANSKDEAGSIALAKTLSARLAV